jgi:glycosyltransferase involved in cell wall biosynthesis
VVFPSTWEGFGIPPIEAAIFDRPAIVGHYPVADELRELGFQWFDPGDIDAVQAWIDRPDPALLEHNRRVVADNLSLGVMRSELRDLLDGAGWLP